MNVFNEQVLTKMITTGRKLPVRACSICKYQCGYIFEKHKLFYDSGCFCLDVLMMEPRDDAELHSWIDKNSESCTKYLEERDS